jgi:hypothetical protein
MSAAVGIIVRDPSYTRISPIPGPPNEDVYLRKMRNVSTGFVLPLTELTFS